MDYYPVFLDLRDRPVLLVGGGRVAEEKIGRLVASGATVTVVAPTAGRAISDAAREGKLTWLARPYERSDTAGMFVVVIATDDGSLNRVIAGEAREAGALVNAADDAANCDFILPAVVKRGRVTLAASTGGTSPAMARWLRGHMVDWLADEVVARADLAADARLEARRREVECAARCPRVGPPPPLCCRKCPNKVSPSRWQEVLGDEALMKLAVSQPENALGQMLHVLGLDAPLVEAPWWREVGA